MFDETFTVFKTGRTCPWCDRAVALLEHLAAPHTVEVMGSELAEIVATVSGIKTVPVIQYGTDWIGGYTDLEQFIEAQGILPDDWN